MLWQISMAYGDGSSSALSTTLITDKGPLWNYETRLEELGDFNVYFVKKFIQGSYLRVEAHLLQMKNNDIAICKKVSRNEKLEMERFMEEYEMFKRNYGSKEAPLPCASTFLSLIKDQGI